jgi:hypothetical protein
MSNKPDDKAFDLMTAVDRAGSEESFEDFLIEYTKSLESGHERPRKLEDIRKVWEGGGKPFVKQYPKGELALEGQRRWGNPQEWDRAFFTKGKNYPAAPDTLHGRLGNLGDMMAEMGHAYDYQLDSEGREQLSMKGSAERNLWGEDVYGGEWKGMYRSYPSYQYDINTIGLPFTDRYLDFTMPYGETTYKEYIPGETKQEDVPAEYHAHSVTERSLWDQLGTDWEKWDMIDKLMSSRIEEFE